MRCPLFEAAVLIALPFRPVWVTFSEFVCCSRELERVRMRDTSQGVEILKQYVLGMLTETEVEGVETQYFAEAESLAELHSVCEDLLEAWLACELPDTEAAKLTVRFHTLPMLREKVAFVQSLQAVIAAS
jgi:hypothetical protein